MGWTTRDDCNHASVHGVSGHKPYVCMRACVRMQDPLLFHRIRFSFEQPGAAWQWDEPDTVVAFLRYFAAFFLPSADDECDGPDEATAALTPRGLPAGGHARSSSGLGDVSTGASCCGDDTAAAAAAPGSAHGEDGGMVRAHACMPGCPWMHACRAAGLPGCPAPASLRCRFMPFGFSPCFLASVPQRLL